MAALSMVFVVLGAAACDAGPEAAADQRGAQALIGPAPSHAWPLVGRLDASAGGVALTTDGFASADPTGLSLDGVSGAAVSAAGGLVDTSQAFTVAAWVSVRRPEILLRPAGPATAVAQQGTFTSAFELGVDAKGRWAFIVTKTDDNRAAGPISAVGPESGAGGRWVHLAGVHDPEAEEIRLVVDGAEVAVADHPAPWTAAGPVTVGRGWNGAAANLWRGAVTQVSFYPEPLDDAAIAAVRVRTRPTAGPPPAPDRPTLLDGAWEYTFTDEESARLEAVLGDEAPAAGRAARVSTVLRFEGGTFQQYFVVDGTTYPATGAPEGDLGTVSVHGATVTLLSEDATVYEWSILGDVLSLDMIDYGGHDRDGAEFVTAHEHRRIDPASHR